MKKLILFLTLVLFTGSLAFGVDVLSEGFEGTFPPTDWVLESATGDNWVQDDGTGHGPGSVYAGTYAAMYNNYDYSSGISGSMTTPAFDASAVVDPQVSFYWWNDDSSYNPATLEILSSTDGTTFTSIETIDVFGSGGWVEYSHSIGLDVTHIKLTATSDYGMDNTFVDEFLVSGLQAGAPGFPTNPSPAIAATYVAVSGDLTWDFGADTETYDLWFGPAGAMTEVVTGATAGTSGSYAYSGLDYGEVYEWQVIAHNSATRFTTEGPVWSFTTENNPIYVQVGDGTTVDQALPIEPFYGYSYSNVIYLAAEIFASGDITGVQYQYQSNSGFGDPDDIVIWMGHTTQSEFIDGDDWIDVTTMTEVFNGQLYFPPAAGDWIQINFTVPFTYDGTDNLVIAWDENTAGYHSSSDDFYCTSTDPVVRGLIYRSDSINPDPTAPPTATYERTYIANVRLNDIVQPFGTLDGYVYESGTTNPIENAEVTCAGVSAITDATGYYIIPVVTTGTHDATADHADYFPETVSVIITEGVTTDQNFGLEWAEIIVDPLFFDISILPDATDDQIITITNDGPHELTYSTGINFLTDGDNTPRPNYLPYNENYPRRKDVELSAGIDMSYVPYKKSLEPSTDILRGSTAWFKGGEYSTYFYGTFDTDTPGDMTEILSPPAWNAYCGDFDAVNTDFFYINNPDDYNIYTIDCATGVETLLGATGLTAHLNGMACDKTTGIMYGCNGTTLYTIDLTAGAATVIGPMGTSSMIDIAIDGSGNLWGIDIGDDNLYGVDKTTGAATVVGPTGYAANFAQGMNWDPELDIIFWGAYGGGLDGNLRIVDTSTGATTLVGDFEGGREVTVLAFPGVGETWLSITNNASGVIPGGGGSVDVTVHFDAAGLTLGTVRTAEIIINHDAVTGGPEVLPVTMTVEETFVAPDVFFSEYIEGSSNNKAIEIYNNTGAVINLDDYRIAQSVNGGGWAYWHIFPVGATVVDGDVWVMLNADTDPLLFDFANADEILAYPSVVHHNGNDARGLEWTPDGGTTWVLVDLIGIPTEDPVTGWDVAGVTAATQNHTLVRKEEITCGNTDWLASAGTDPTDSEWIVYDQNTFIYLGQHPGTGAILDPPANVFVNDNTWLLTWLPPGGIISSDDFESYVVGEYLAAQSDLWTTWSNAPGTAEDAYVSDAQSLSGTQSVVVEGTSDLVYLMDEYTSGVYSMEVNLYVPTGYCGYWNLQKTNLPYPGEWAFQIQFDVTGIASADAGAAAALTFPFSFDTWINMELVVDLNADWCEIWVDGVMLYEYQWTLGCFGTPGLLQFGGMNLFAWASTGNSPMCYFDDIALRVIEPADGTRETRDLIGFNVYLDAALLTTPPLDPDVYEYQYTGLTPLQEYTAGVSAVYDEGESEIIQFIFIAQPEVILPPENLTADIVTYNDVLLNWEAPGEWIGWDQGVYGNAIGLQAGGEFYVASRWDPAALAPYDGYELTKISFFPHSDVPTTYELMVWTGANAGTLVLTQPVTTFVFDDFNEVVLDTPVIIDASQELWFGYATNHVADQTPAGTDPGPAIAGYGDMITMDGGSIWNSLAGLGLDYNWLLQGYVMESDGEAIALTPPQRTKNVAPVRINSNVQLSVAHNTVRRTNTAVTDDLRILLGYKVYKDGVEIFYIDDPDILTYTDLGVEPGIREYHVTAIFDGGESIPSNIESVDIVLPIPQNPFASFIYPNVLVTWDPITDGRDLASYNVYRDADPTPIGTTTSTMYVDPDLPSGEYFYNITAVYDGPAPGYESEWSEDSNVVPVVGSGNILIPLRTELTGNYPNPFNPVTTIKFALKEDSNVSINIYNIKGALVRTLVDGEMKAAYHTVIWDSKDNTGKQAGSGLYFYKMISDGNNGDYTSTKKMILLK